MASIYKVVFLMRSPAGDRATEAYYCNQVDTLNQITTLARTLALLRVSCMGIGGRVEAIRISDRTSEVENGRNRFPAVLVSPVQVDDRTGGIVPLVSPGAGVPLLGGAGTLTERIQDYPEVGVVSAQVTGVTAGVAVKKKLYMAFNPDSVVTANTDFGGSDAESLKYRASRAPWAAALAAFLAELQARWQARTLVIPATVTKTVVKIGTDDTGLVALFIKGDGTEFLMNQKVKVQGARFIGQDGRKVSGGLNRTWRVGSTHVDPDDGTQWRYGLLCSSGLVLGRPCVLPTVSSVSHTYRNYLDLRFTRWGKHNRSNAPLFPSRGASVRALSGRS